MFSGRLFSLCLRYTNNEDQAKDSFQEGFIRIFNKLSQYKNRGSLEGWMRKIMVNCALEKIRKENHYISLEDGSVTDDNLFNYEHILEAIEEKELLGMIGELSTRYKLVFNLYAIEGYSHREISKILNISVGTSKSNLFRARALLRNKIEVRYSLKLGKAIS
jgi:RNA polymerase sigma-70 factor (ECF subfamily)